MHLNPQVVETTGFMCFPAMEQVSGTFTSSGLVVTGSNTLFLSEICTGSGNNLKYKYLFSSTNKEIREIDFVINDTLLRLKSSFTSDAAGDDVNCPDYRFACKEVSIFTAGSATSVACTGGTLQTILANVGVNFKTDDGLKPIAVDGNGDTVQITTLI